MLREVIRILLRQPKFALELDLSHIQQTILVNGASFLHELIELIQSQPNITYAGIIEHWRNSKYESRLKELAPTDSEYGDEDAPLHEKQQLLGVFNDALGKLAENSKRDYVNNLEMSDEAKQQVRERMEQLQNQQKK